MIKYQLIATHASARPQGLAIIDGERRISWREMADHVARVSTGLSHLLSGAQNPPATIRAVFISENRWEVPVLQAAAGSIGLSLIGIDDTLPVEHVAECIKQVQPALVAFSPSRRGLATQALSLLRDADGLAKAPTLVSVSEKDDWETGSPDVSWKDLAAKAGDPDTWVSLPFQGLGFTSGTTNAPKLVLRSRSFEAQRQRDITAFFGVTPDDVYLNTVPLYHASGPGWARIFATHGAPVVLAPYHDAEAMVDAAERERATATLLVPPTLQSLLNHVDQRATTPDLALRVVVTGGRHVSPALVRQSHRLLGDVLHIYYGTTETGLNTLTRTGEITTEPGTAGPPLPGNRVFILDDDDRPLPAGETGRVAVAGYMLADTYATTAAPTVEVDGETAWLTPDIGRLDAQGRLFVASRDLPAQVRDVNVVALEGHLKDALPVTDLAVLLDIEDGNPRITVAYATGESTELASTAVAAATSRQVGGIPVEAHRLSAIPYSPTGKIRARALRALIQDHLDSKQP